METKENRIAQRSLHTSTGLGLALSLVAAVLVFLIPAQIEAHGAPVIDGLYLGDWCAPAQVGLFGPDSLTPLGPPLCPLGSEIFWDDWDGLNYGPPDTIGFAIGGLPGLPPPGAPLPDPEVDIDFFATTADPTNVFFTVSLGPYPSTVAVPPHVQIAIDVDGAPNGLGLWYDPLVVGTNPVGLFPPPGLPADYLITTDTPVGIAQVWEAISVPGAWTPAGPPVPLAWSGVFAPLGAPSVIELVVPWANFFPPPPPPGLPFVPGTPAMMTVMATHGAPFAGVADAPGFPADDVFSESGAGFTTSLDICPPGPPPPSTSDCEIWIGPGGGVLSADAFIPVLYPTADLAITKTNGFTSVIPGTLVTYTITASHAAGPSPANGALVTDTFPVSLTGCTWSCTGSGGGVCTPMGVGNINDAVNLPVGAAVTYTATCILSSTATGTLVNTAIISPPIGIIEPNPINDTATDTDTILGLDYGDAPDPTYPTLLASNGARHAATGAFLGAAIDVEIDGQPTAAANGDDLNGSDDEDGVIFTSPVTAGQLSMLTVTAAGAGLLDAWVDFNLNGWFDAGEQIFVSAPLVPGANALSFTPPAAASAAASFGRFRFSSTGGLGSFGLALDGEVEDHQLSVTRSSDLAISKTDSRDPATAGLGLRYTLTTTNNGPSDASSVTVTDNLPASTIFLGSVPGSPTCAESSGTVTCNLGQLAPSTSTDVIITVLVDSAATGSLSNTASVSANEPDPVSGNDSDNENTAVVTPLFADSFESGDVTAWDSSVP